MSVNPASHVPIYEQIVEHIRGAVAAGVHRRGDMLPSIRALALELTVNPNTVQRAYQELERQGLVSTRKGVGAFVTDGGEASAQNWSVRTVYARFAQGVDTGRAARLTDEHLRTVFERAVGGTGPPALPIEPDAAGGATGPDRGRDAGPGAGRSGDDATRLER